MCTSCICWLSPRLLTPYAQGVDSVTDFVQEKGAADTGKLQAAIGSIGAVKGAAVAAAVVLNESEVKVLMDECEITKEAAEQLLRKNGNELRTAMLAFARGQ